MEKFYLLKDDSYCVLEQTHVYFFAYHLFSSLVNKIPLSAKSLNSFQFLRLHVDQVSQHVSANVQYKDRIHVLSYKKRLTKNLESINTVSSIEDIKKFFINLKEAKEHCDIILDELNLHKKQIKAMKVADLIDKAYYFGYLELKQYKNSHMHYDQAKLYSFGEIYKFSQIIKNPLANLLLQWEGLFDEQLNLKNVEYLKNDIEHEYFHYVIFCENGKKETGFWGNDSSKTRYSGNAQLFSLAQAKLFQTEKQVRNYCKNTIYLSDYAILKVKSSLDSVLEVVGKPNTQVIDLFQVKKEKQFLEDKMERNHHIKESLLDLKASDLAYALEKLCPHDEVLKNALAKYLVISEIKPKTNKVKI